MTPSNKRRRPTPSEVMALSFLAILATHMMPQLAEDHPWTSLAWAALLAAVTVAACIDVIVERHRDRRSS